MSGKQIGIVYYYLVSIAGLVLIVLGLYHSANLFVNLTQYDKYPLKYGMIDECNYPMPMAVKGMMGQIPQVASNSGSASGSLPLNNPRKYQRSCEVRIELQRKEHRIEDIKNALTFTLIGVALFLFHFPQARKQSR